MLRPFLSRNRKIEGPKKDPLKDLWKCRHLPGPESPEIAISDNLLVLLSLLPVPPQPGILVKSKESKRESERERRPMDGRGRGPGLLEKYKAET